MAQKTVVVFAHLPGETSALAAGELTLTEEGSRLKASSFIYGTRYITRKAALEVDPVALQFKTKGREPGEVIVPKNSLERFGAIADGAPDAWGRRVIEAELQAAPNSLPESEYLIRAGTNRVGALDVRPERESQPITSPTLAVNSLEEMADAARRLDSGERISKSILRLLLPGGSMGGARPKAVIEHKDALWLAKFPAATDGFNIPRVEYATLLLAKKCGLTVPDVEIIQLNAKNDVMLIRRFDRTKKENGYARQHYVSALTLLAKHESESINSSYVEIVAAFRRYGDPARIKGDSKELFARMVFNILCNNNDDHLKNHGFVWNGKGFELSPLFDVVPKPEAMGNKVLHLSIGEQGRTATLDNALSKHAAFNLNLKAAVEVIEQMAAKTEKWPQFMEEHGVSAKDIDALRMAFAEPSRIGLREVGKSPRKRIRV